MPTYYPIEQFEPKERTKKHWLWTRKARLYIPEINFTLPGVFGTVGFRLDAILFASAMILEVWGMINFVRVLEVESLWYLLGPIGADIAGAIIHILSHGFIKKNQNGNFAKLPERGETNVLAHIGYWFGTLIIVGSAIFKIGGFFAGYQYGLDGLSTFIMLSYVAVAYVHLKHTGYFLSESFLLTIGGWNRQSRNHRKNKQLSSENWMKERISPKPLEGQFNEVKSDYYWFYRIPGTPEGNPKFTIRTLGLLLDDDIFHIYTQNTNLSKERIKELLVYLVDFQFNIIRQTPSNNEAPDKANYIKISNITDLIKQ